MNTHCLKFREVLINYLPWTMLCITLIVSVTIENQKMVTNIYRVLVCLPIIFLIKKHDLKIFISNSFNKLFLCLLGYTFITLTWGINNYTDNFMGKLLTTFLFSYLLFLIAIYNSKKLLQIENLYLTACLIFLIMVPFYRETDDLFKIGGMTHSAFPHHSPLGWFLSTSFIICFYNYMLKEKGTHQYTYLFLSIFLIFLIFINQSRGGILVTLNGILGILILTLKKEDIKKLIFIASLSIVFLSCLFFAFDSFFMRLIDRSDAGRFVIYQNAWTAITESWFSFFFGQGSNTLSSNYINTFKAVNYHNLYLDTWFNLGLLGLVLLIFCICYRLLPVLTRKIKHNVWDAVLFGILAGTLTDGGRFYSHPGAMLLCFILPLVLSNLIGNLIIPSKNIQTTKS